MSPRRLSVLAVAIAVLGLSACSDGDRDADAAPPTTAIDALGADTDDMTDTTDMTDTVVPVDQNGTDVCAALTGEMVAEATGEQITGTDGYGVGTPQCSYAFDDDGTITTVSIAAQRTEEDLGGLTGLDALDLAVRASEALPENRAESRDVSIAGAQAAAAIEGDVISGVIVLAEDGQVYTVFSPTLDPEQLASVAEVTVEVLSS